MRGRRADLEGDEVVIRVAAAHRDVGDGVLDHGDGHGVGDRGVVGGRHAVALDRPREGIELVVLSTEDGGAGGEDAQTALAGRGEEVRPGGEQPGALGEDLGGVDPGVAIGILAAGDEHGAVGEELRIVGVAILGQRSGERPRIGDRVVELGLQRVRVLVAVIEALELAARAAGGEHQAVAKLREREVLTLVVHARDRAPARDRGVVDVDLAGRTAVALLAVDLVAAGDHHPSIAEQDSGPAGVGHQHRTGARPAAAGWVIELGALDRVAIAVLSARGEDLAGGQQHADELRAARRQASGEGPGAAGGIVQLAGVGDALLGIVAADHHDQAAREGHRALQRARVGQLPDRGGIGLGDGVEDRAGEGERLPVIATSQQHRPIGEQRGGGADARCRQRRLGHPLGGERAAGQECEDCSAGARQDMGACSGQE